MPRKKKVLSEEITKDSPPISSQNIRLENNKECCNNCGKCENCLHPMGNIKNYTPLLMLLLIVSSFLLGMLLTKLGYLESNGSYPTTTSGTTGTNQQAQNPTSAPKPLHVAQATGMDATAFKKCLDSDKYAQQVAADLSDGQKAGVTGTPAFFIDGLSLVGAQPYTVFQQTINQELAGSRANTPNIFSQLSAALSMKAYAQTVTDTTTPTPAARVNVTVGPFPVLGNPNAPVTIIEYADFQCPFCKEAFTTVEPNIIKDYVNTGKAKFAFKNYAFLGPESIVAAEGAYCANDQGKFWAYHNFLYQHQGAESSGQFTKTNLE